MSGHEIELTPVPQVDEASRARRAWDAVTRHPYRVAGVALLAVSGLGAERLLSSQDDISEPNPEIGLAVGWHGDAEASCDTITASIPAPGDPENYDGWKDDPAQAKFGGKTKGMPEGFRSPPVTFGIERTPKGSEPVVYTVDFVWPGTSESASDDVVVPYDETCWPPETTVPATTSTTTTTTTEVPPTTTTTTEVPPTTTTTTTTSSTTTTTTPVTTTPETTPPTTPTTPETTPSTTTTTSTTLPDVELCITDLDLDSDGDLDAHFATVPAGQVQYLVDVRGAIVTSDIADCVDYEPPAVTTTLPPTSTLPPAV